MSVYRKPRNRIWHYINHIKGIQLTGGVNYIPPYADDSKYIALGMNDSSMILFENSDTSRMSEGNGFGIRYLGNGRVSNVYLSCFST